VILEGMKDLGLRNTAAEGSYDETLGVSGHLDAPYKIE
jgi:hypothetical protein